ncbi:FtsW/RodA/SpoVE family cell cycle protein [Streptomyces sp. NBC_01190]|uniref:FtsW/RodA/SpoVE family cell cycle protein n=1 Tax=Streptomyces sp. NBC_01190 TaxID=2903767 RepID=UPI00386320C5|nr:FtsW/RodA/SpoVE family cell cycle protein [Streptomyces sp. NBC_01190]
MSASNTTTITSIGAPNRRNTELALLVFAVVIPLFAYVNVGLAKNDSVPAGLLGYGVGLGVLAGGAHLLVRKYAPYADPLMLPIATLLNGLGLVLIWRLDQEPSLGAAMAPNQLMWSALGLVLFVLVLVFLKDHRILQRYTYISMVVALVLLIAPIFFPGVNGAKIWITLPGIGSLQPGEFAKIIITVFFAGYLMVKRDALALASRRFMGLYLPRGRDLGPILVVWAISLLILVFETDLGTSLLFFGLFVIMLYVATERTSWIVFGLLLSGGGAVLVSMTEPHVQVRVQNWLHPLALENGGVTETAQAMYAFGSGGIFGSGLGQGYSRLILGIAPKSDYILATVGEELGLAGLMAVLLLYGLLIERGIRTALAARDPFGKLLAIGLSGAFALQVFVVAGGVTGLIPLTGMTMPFLAQGGSSVIANWALVAILLRISDTARRPAPSPAPSPDVEATQVVRSQ